MLILSTALLGRMCGNAPPAQSQRLSLRPRGSHELLRCRPSPLHRGGQEFGVRDSRVQTWKVGQFERDTPKMSPQGGRCSEVCTRLSPLELKRLMSRRVRNERRCPGAWRSAGRVLQLDPVGSKPNNFAFKGHPET